MNARPTLSFRPTAADLDRVMRTFGVAEQQARRDFVISWMLWAVSQATPGVVFFGGTALSRTLLPDLRLSEDIDLMPIEPRSTVANVLHQHLTRDLERGFGRVTADIALPDTRHPSASVYTVGGHRVRVQLVDRDSFSWPRRAAQLEQRFSGCPPVTMSTFTSEGFAAAKTTAWCERNEPRDLYDLWALAVGGHITPAAAAVFVRFGPTNRPPSPAVFPSRPPSDQEWKDALSHQCVPAVDPAQAYQTVVEAWRTATRNGPAMRWWK